MKTYKASVFGSTGLIGGFLTDILINDPLCEQVVTLTRNEVIINNKKLKFFIGDVKGKTCILVDDIIDSGGTIVNAAKALKNRGAKDVFVYITHGVLSGDAVKKIKNSVIKNLVITDTIDNVERTKNVKNIEVLPISGLMGEAIKRISNSTSVSDLFK